MLKIFLEVQYYDVFPILANFAKTFSYFCQKFNYLNNLY